MPDQTNLIVQSEMSCLLQRTPIGAKKATEANVPPISTHHILLFWTRGATKMNFQLEERRQRINLKPWDGIYMPPGCPSWWDNGPECLEGIFHIHLANELVEEATSSNINGRTLATVIENEHVIQLARMVLACSEIEPSPPKLVWDSYALLISHHLFKSKTLLLERFRGGLAPWQLRRTTDFLIENAHLNVGISQLASLVGLSPFHFARAFKQSTGVPPHRYQLNVRITKAKALLELTDAPVTSIAFDVGYESSQALARLFRREVGVSPSEYRRQFVR
ncbi:MAG: helix-turn-helix transcriptional regulator [Sphingopyxis sp.]|nr:helix-turn-helix transcriptional regulator [Sphingopyxis sp.]